MTTAAPAGSASLRPPTFTPRERLLAFAVAALVEATLLVGGFAFGGSNLRVHPEAAPDTEKPMAVKPVLDDAPKLLLGGGKQLRPKLPDAWAKKPPRPLPPDDELSAPAPDAVKEPEAIPSSAVAKADAAPTPADAGPLEASVEPSDAAPLTSASAEPAPSAAPADSAVAAPVGSGDPDGVKDGTETDPLKARALTQYRSRLIAWFNARFHRPDGQIPCAELQRLSAGGVAQISGDGTVTSVSLTRASNHSVFDAAARAALESAVGQPLPPPPPLYPELMPKSVSTVFSGAGAKCE